MASDPYNGKASTDVKWQKQLQMLCQNEYEDILDKLGDKVTLDGVWKELLRRANRKQKDLFGAADIAQVKKYLAAEISIDEEVKNESSIDRLIIEAVRQVGRK